MPKILESCMCSEIATALQVTLLNRTVVNIESWTEQRGWGQKQKFDWPAES